MKWWSFVLVLSFSLNLSSAGVIIHTEVDDSPDCTGPLNGKIEYSTDRETPTGFLFRKIHDAFMKTLFKIIISSAGGMKLDFAPAKPTRELPCNEDGNAKVIEKVGSDAEHCEVQKSNNPITWVMHDQNVEDHKINGGHYAEPC
ncbi:uncharacterized protein LOC124156199 isoform X2 [Ischnura elegans]|uniref:uncharacterized protein LOC124156199 isoform X2 n=1 Tax=Ischnura elegans TaxID=197161 RepID=UPI001ED8B97C|nr:uncharacterized protein LOC124156199 isoform X2 [Ischnura elegans]